MSTTNKTWNNRKRSKFGRKQKELKTNIEDLKKFYQI